MGKLQTGSSQSDFKEMIAFPNVLLVAYLTLSGL